MQLQYTSHQQHICPHRRMLTGISLGGCFPLVFSLLGDLFPISQRSAVSAVVQIAMGLGLGLGQARQ